MPSEEMRKAARTWLYHLDHPNETASQAEVDDLATLLDHVRDQEREACALECDDEVRKQAHVPEDPTDTTSRSIGKSAAAVCAWRIRKRKNKN